MKHPWKIIAAACLSIMMAACSSGTGSAAASAAATASAKSSASTASISEDTVLAAYKSTASEMKKFYTLGYSVDTGDSQQVQANGATYYRVKDYATLADLKSHLSTMLEDSCVNALMEQMKGVYTDIDGKLYMVGADAPDLSGLGEETDTVTKVSDTKYVVNVSVPTGGSTAKPVEFQFPYELVDGNWRFTSFPMIQ